MGLTEIEESADSVAPPPLEWRIDLTNFRFTWWMVSRDLPIWTGSFQEYVEQTKIQLIIDFSYNIDIDSYAFGSWRTWSITRNRQLFFFQKFGSKLPVVISIILNRNTREKVDFYLISYFYIFLLFWKKWCYFGALDMADTLSLNFSNDVNTLNYQKPLLD